jgi:hypothetical protein
MGFRNLELTKSVATKYGSGDLVLNLNYDTVFEIALNQLVRPFVYAPKPKEDELVVCKPHGSINLVTNETTFAFGQPEWWGIPEPQGFRSFLGFVPLARSLSVPDGLDFLDLGQGSVSTLGTYPQRGWTRIWQSSRQS